MKSFYIFTFVLLFAFTSQAKQTDLSYTLTRKDSVTLLVTVAFNGNGKGTTLLHLPNEWAGQKVLYNAVSGLTALSPQALVSKSGKPDIYYISYPAGEKVEFSYLLHKDWEGPLKHPLYFRPVIQPDYFYFEGYSGLVYPELEDSKHIKCRLTYKGFSSDAFTGNSFFANAKQGSFIVSLDNLLDSIFCAGNLRSKTISDANGHKVVIALTGNPAFSDDEAFSSIYKIIKAERQFWDDAGPDYYFTLFLPLYDQGNTGGTAHYHAFSLFQSADLGLTGNLLPMIAHEYFHNWLGLGLKMPLPDEPYKWFSEGFTEYYSYKVLYQTGIINRQEFLANINNHLKNYFLSPYFNLPNQELIGRYWDSSDLKSLSYNRGLAIAFLLDASIEEITHKSLDELLRKLYQESEPEMTFPDKLFDNLVIGYSDPATLEAIKQANEGNNTALFKQLMATHLYSMSSLDSKEVFDLGFDYEASKAAGKIIGLESGSNAAKAGLTENMKLSNKFSIWFNNTEKPAMIGVINNNEETFIQYIPVLKAEKKVPQIDIEN